MIGNNWSWCCRRSMGVYPSLSSVGCPPKHLLVASGRSWGSTDPSFGMPSSQGRRILYCCVSYGGILSLAIAVLFPKTGLCQTWCIGGSYPSCERHVGCSGSKYSPDRFPKSLQKHPNRRLPAGVQQTVQQHGLLLSLGVLDALLSRCLDPTE